MIDQLNFTKRGGVVAVVTQDATTGAVLMVAEADFEAVTKTLETGEMHYRSRSRGLWHKGATSGNVQRVVRLVPDCDGDTILAQVIPAGPACHTGAVTCFGDIGAGVLGRLDRTIAARAAAPGTGYTAKLLADRNLRLKKLGEEAAELAVACADGDRERAAEEAADLVYHTLVAVRAAGASLADVEAALSRREPTSTTIPK